jgi:hypothetical protein
MKFEPGDLIRCQRSEAIWSFDNSAIGHTRKGETFLVIGVDAACGCTANDIKVLHPILGSVFIYSHKLKVIDEV